MIPMKLLHHDVELWEEFWVPSQLSLKAASVFSLGIAYDNALESDSPDGIVEPSFCEPIARRIQNPISVSVLRT